MLGPNESLSVYNVHRLSKQQPTHALSDLENNPEEGWGVSRHPLKPLNHLDYLMGKEKIAETLLLHNLRTPPAIFERNYARLDQHQKGALSTEQVVLSLQHELHAYGTQKSAAEIRELLQEFATVRHMEFHPSDVCNLKCLGCTYGHDNPATKPLPINFPFAHIEKISTLQPRSMVIIGGGEPTLYRNKQNGFQELIENIIQFNPDITLALTTNGTFKPKGSWPNQFSWIRLSLDAATPETYRAFRGKNHFHHVVSNFLDYLDYDVPYVGISFLFAQANIHEYAAVAAYIFNLVKKEKPQHLSKVNIQYRPLRRDPHNYHLSFEEAVNQGHIEKAVQDVRALANSSGELKNFLKNQTNVTAILGGNTHPPHDFSRCYYSETFKIVRANGDIRPCFIRVVEPDFHLGNILHDPLEKIALNNLYINARRKPHCTSHGCRQCHVNFVLEQGIQGNIKPSQSPEVLADPMF